MSMLKDYLQNFKSRFGKKTNNIFKQYKKNGRGRLFFISQTYFEFILLRGEGIILKTYITLVISSWRKKKKMNHNIRE